jgi:hypothetical protein
MVILLLVHLLGVVGWESIILLHLGGDITGLAGEYRYLALLGEWMIDAAFSQLLDWISLRI